ncbi:MAG: sulfatase-like hydrolase/transferase [Pseudolabrys sp.]
MIPINARLPIGAPTPNLDRLASEGMRFVNYYGQASCTAGRASFITGRIPIRTSLSAVLAPAIPTASPNRHRPSPNI